MRLDMAQIKQNYENSKGWRELKNMLLLSGLLGWVPCIYG